jgi:hypothetical protein
MFVKDAKRAWRWFSVQAFAIQGAAGATWLTLPPDMRAAVPDTWMAGFAVALSIMGIMGRIVDQGGDDAGTNP